jgi:hypothetical protein
MTLIPTRKFLPYLYLLVFVCFYFSSSSQETKKKTSFFVNPEYMIGKIIPVTNNYDFPKTKYQQIVTTSFGFSNSDTTKWGRFYNCPEAGVLVLYSNLGNNKILGHQLGILPFLSLKVFNNFKSPFRLKLAAGLAYFSNRFDSISNPTNEVVGSHFAWDVKVFLYKSLLKKNGFNLQLGMGFSHQSNGHTRLPNLGINTPMISLSGQIYNNKKDNYISSQRVKGGNISPKNYFITLNQSIGIHEQDETEGPKMGELKPVYVSGLSGAILFNKHIKLRSGFTYRFYQQYYDHVLENDTLSLSETPKKSASNISFFMGNEFLMGHVSIDAQLGINIYKPFYHEFNKSPSISTKLQRTLLTRIGLNLYLINTHKLPKHNLFIGAYIKANMLKADYSEFSFGYTYKIN